MEVSALAPITANAVQTGWDRRALLLCAILVARTMVSVSPLTVVTALILTGGQVQLAKLYVRLAFTVQIVKASVIVVMAHPVTA